jgi:hypothetical protein
MAPTILRFATKAAGRAICAAFLLSLGSAAALAEDPRCEQLVALHRQYAGVALTSEQQSLKRKLVAWYGANCGGLHRSAGR